MSTAVNEPSETSNATPADATEPTSSIVDSVFDTTLAWIDAGLGRVRGTLSAAARSLMRTARALDVIRERLRGSSSDTPSSNEPATSA